MLFVLSLPVKCDGTVPASVFLHPCPTSREKPACRQSHSQGKEMRPRMHDKPKRTAAQVRGQGMHKRMRTCTTPAARTARDVSRRKRPAPVSTLVWAGFLLRTLRIAMSGGPARRTKFIRVLAKTPAPCGTRRPEKFFRGRHRTKSRGRERSAGLACEPPAVRKDSRPRS